MNLGACLAGTPQFVLCVTLAGGAAALAQPQVEEAKCMLRVELVDARSGQAVPGLIQLRSADGRQVPLPRLLDRGLGLSSELAIHDWYVMVEPTVLQVPGTRLSLRAFSGLETEITEIQLDLSDKTETSCRVELHRFYDAEALGWQSANTHVHLKNTSRPETDRYLIDCSQADDLNVLFVSYLERPSEDAHYSTNAYTRLELQSMSKKTDVLSQRLIPLRRQVTSRRS